MDLRGFSEKNAGCIFELHQLASQERLLDAAFVIDRTSDLELLESTLGPVSDARAHLERIEKDSSAERDRVYRSLTLLQSNAVVRKQGQ